MKNLLTVVGDGNAAPVLDTSLMVAQRFNGHIVGLHSLTTEYAVVFGGEMGFSISSEVDRALEREGHDRRDQARRLFRDFMNAKGVPIGPVTVGHNGPSASWRCSDTGSAGRTAPSSPSASRSSSSTYLSSRRVRIRIMARHS